MVITEQEKLRDDDKATKKWVIGTKWKKNMNISEIVIKLNNLNPRFNKQNTIGIKSVEKLIVINWARND